MSEAEVYAAVELARKHDLLILSDEIYEPFLYDVGPALPAANTAHRLAGPASHYEKTVVLRGFSKSHAMTGWRIGYAAGFDPVVAQMTKLQQYSFVCAPSPFQHAALAALDIPMHQSAAAYRKKLDIAFEILSRKFEVVKPQGAFYIFPKAPPGTTATDFVASAIENNVLIIPGNVFSDRDTHFRISYAVTDEKLARGCEILCSLV